MQIVSNASIQLKWKRAFQDAVFELDPTRLQPKLDAAQKAIEHRVAQVLSSGSNSPRELMELEDAKRTIRYLARHELQLEM
jgi:multidrug resistance efflux pump